MSDQKSHEILAGEIVIELDDPKNCDLHFYPLSEKFRSVVIPDRSGSGKPAAFTGIYRIPGHRIHVNVQAKKGRITDGLGAEENARILADVKRASNSADGKFSMPFGDPNPPQVKSLTDDDVETWLYWMSRFVASGQAKLIQGKLDSPDDIRNRGHVKLPVADVRVAKAEFGDTKYYKPDPKPAASGKATANAN